jgi:hypothetical protein
MIPENETPKRQLSWKAKLLWIAAVVLGSVTVIIMGISGEKSRAAVGVSEENNDPLDFAGPSHDDDCYSSGAGSSCAAKRVLPTEPPSLLPSTYLPTYSPSLIPSDGPSYIPSAGPSETPTEYRYTSATPTGAPTKKLTSAPTKQSVPKSEDGVNATYTPGKLTTLQAGLLLSEGLGARRIGTSGEQVEYADGTLSEIKFHGLPDGAETFADTGENNEGGWIYVSNSEMKNKGEGGVGAIAFDKDGNILDYRMVLENTSMNCGGGGTPWNTWVSCEEIEFDGLIYQVDPTGEREAQVMTLGSDGGRWEAFAFDIRDRSKPRFFVTEDHNKGTVRRFTPNNPDWDKPWDMLHGDGVVLFLMVHPTSSTEGTFEWTTDKEAAKNNARTYYPQTEGIDVYESQLFFVCKNIKQVFIVNLDEGTYSNRTTVNGLFDGKPDQMQRILDDPNDILYFTEEGGVDAVSTPEVGQ